MNEPVPYQGGGTVSGDVIKPAAVASAQSSAVFALGNLLKNIVHRSVGMFHNENDVIDALNVIDSFVRVFVPSSAMPALATGEQMAPLEDVSLRIPPGQNYPNPPAGPGIDYMKLAQAIVAVQQRQQQEETDNK